MRHPKALSQMVRLSTTSKYKLKPLRNPCQMLVTHKVSAQNKVELWLFRDVWARWCSNAVYWHAFMPHATQAHTRDMWSTPPKPSTKRCDLYFEALMKGVDLFFGAKTEEDQQQRNFELCFGAIFPKGHDYSTWYDWSDSALIVGQFIVHCIISSRRWALVARLGRHELLLKLDPSQIARKSGATTKNGAASVSLTGRPLP